MKFRFLILCLGTFLWSSFSFAQQDLLGYLNKFDSENLDEKVLYNPQYIQWVEDANAFAYMINTPSGKKIVQVDVNTLKKKETDFKKLIAALEKESGEEVTAANFRFGSLVFQKESLLYKTRAADWQVDVHSFQVHKKEKSNVNGDEYAWASGNGRYRFDQELSSPDKKHLAFIREFNVYVKDLNAPEKEAVQLSYDGSPGEFYTSNSLLWSPDSKKLFAQKVRPGYDRKVQMIESSPKDQLQPKLHTRSYTKPGDVLPQIKPTIFLIAEEEQVNSDPYQIDNQYTLSDFKWRPDSQHLVFEYNKRAHQNYQVLQMDATTGAFKVLINEETDTFFPYTEIYGKKFRYDVNDGKEIIWASERDGWNHLYLYDGVTGAVKNQITKGEWVVRKVVHVDEKNRTVLFEAGGFDKQQDPYFLQLFRINFDGTGLQQLTTENANHLMYFSEDYSYFVDSYSRVDMPPITVLRRSSDGKVIEKLAEADASALLEMGWKFPEIYTAKGRDGETDIWGIMIKPSDFDPQKNYPLIEYIYAGPHDSFVPKSFTTNPRVSMYGLAELGFIVVQIDGMGTSNRSKKFHDVAFKNLKDAGFPDRILWIKELAKKYSFIDISKVGIYGRSAGGQSSSAALLFHPEFYKVAVSTAGSHDNRMDKIWWNEQWMGYPIGPQYKENSNPENAWRLEGDLMLQVSELDTNVDPSTTYQFVNALINSDKTFEFVLLPGEDHQPIGHFAELKRREFFTRKLLK